jgi:hypothetical protein
MLFEVAPSHAAHATEVRTNRTSARA